MCREGTEYKSPCTALTFWLLCLAFPTIYCISFVPVTLVSTLYAFSCSSLTTTLWEKYYLVYFQISILRFTEFLKTALNHMASKGCPPHTYTLSSLQPSLLNHYPILKMLAAQLCLTLCDSMDCSPPAFSVQGILQARIVEWVAILFSRVSCQSSDRTQVSCIAGRFFTIWATREAPPVLKPMLI